MTSDEIQDRINNPGKHGITKIHVLRDKRNQLPVNKQVGTTCGIYALDAALRIQAIEFAPRKRERTAATPPGSIREKAKAMGLTKIGCRTPAPVTMARRHGIRQKVLLASRTGAFNSGRTNAGTPGGL
jgi:hypothetical protein